MGGWMDKQTAFAMDWAFRLRPKCRLSSLYPKCLGLEVFQLSDFGIHIQKEISWGCDPNLNIKFIYVLYIPYI
jgi:hypothetical protein